MQILAMEKELKPIETELHGEILRHEAARVWELKKQGVVRDMWFTCRDRTAIVMLECATEDEARRQLATLPLVRAGLITFDVLALRSYDGFDRLITS